jgi:zinc transporter 1/2/3
MLSFGHLLPEAVVMMERHSAGQGGVALVYTLVGYAAMLFVEKIAFTSSSVAESTHAHADTIVAESRSDSSEQHPRNPQNRMESSAHSAQSAIALCCAMSIHSFFESAALGLAPDAASTYMMAACIALHQPAESVALLVSFLKSGMRTGSIVLWLVGFSLVSLAGVVAGMLVKGLASGEMEAVVTALTAGTFVYVGATEVCLAVCFLGGVAKCALVVPRLMSVSKSANITPAYALSVSMVVPNALLTFTAHHRPV